MFCTFFSPRALCQYSTKAGTYKHAFKDIQTSDLLSWIISYRGASPILTHQLTVRSFTPVMSSRISLLRLWECKMFNRNPDVGILRGGKDQTKVSGRLLLPPRSGHMIDGGNNWRSIHTTSMEGKIFCWESLIFSFVNHIS